MSSINDPEQPQEVQSIFNAKPGIIMEAFSQAGESNLVFIINELDKEIPARATAILPMYC